MPAPTQTRRILVKVDTSNSKALRDIADKMGYLNRNTKSLSSNMSFLTNIFRGWLGFLGIREVARMADGMQNLSNRLKITAQEGENTSETLDKIAALADRNLQSIQDTGVVYNRLAISLSKVNPRADELIALSDVLINTFRVAGAGVAETSNTIIQLSQAFQSGELRGQELRSVMEQNGVLAKLLNKEFGSDVYKKAEKGQIRVTDVLKLLAKEQKNVSEQAKQLAPTFEQVMTKAMNKLSVAIGKLNTQFGLSAKFATVMEFAIDNLASALVIGAGVLGLWVSTYIPSLIRGFQALRVAAIAFAAANPILLALTAISVVAGLVWTNFDKLRVMFKKVRAAGLDFAASMEETLLPLRMKFAKFIGLDPQAIKKDTMSSVASLRKAASETREEIKKIEEESKKGEKPGSDPGKDLDSLIEKLSKFDKTKPKAEKIKDILGQINKELRSGAISIGEYNRKLVNFELYKLNREFEEGKFDIFTYNQRLRELNLQELNRQLRAGVISFDQFRDKVSQSGIEELTAKFEAGKITLTEYNSELIKVSEKLQPGAALQSGTASYMESIGTLSENIARGITNTFGVLEDTLVDFVKTGQISFKKMTESILEDLTRIIIRASIMRPLAGAILNGFGGGGAAGATLPASNADFSGFAAKGMAFDNGVRKFAKGGIVDSPTAFRYGGGRTGLMGEAGTEAIVPLRRASNGDLGVAASVTPVNINIINQTGSQVEQRETTGPNGEKTIDVLIFNRVREGILTGKFDGAMKQSFGVNRKGS